MVDGYNRTINYLRVSVTDRCNLRCSYCVPKEGVSLIGHDDILRYEEILRVIRIAVKLGIVKVRITGGEPLVRRNIIRFIAALNQVPGLQDVSLTTNGILLEALAEPLLAAGIKRVNVSLDSFDPQKYAEITRGGDVNKVLRGIEKAHSIGLAPVKINVVAINGFNDDEIIDFARYTLENPFQVRFIEYMPIGSLSGRFHHLPNSTIIEKIERFRPLEPVVKKNHSTTDGPARLYRMKGAQGEIGFISSMSNHFCESCNRLRLTADGCLRACLFSKNETDLKTPLREGCSDEDLEMLIIETINNKPQTFNLDHQQETQFKKCARNMVAIGG